MKVDNEPIKFNPYRCKAVGLTEAEARCLNFVRLHTPPEARMRQTFPKVGERLEHMGLLERIDGMWRLTEAGKSKLRVLLEGK